MTIELVNSSMPKFVGGRVGIIIPTCNLSWMTNNLLKSICCCSRRERFVIIVVDNGSGSLEVKSVISCLQGLGFDYLFFHSKTPLGFVKAVNYGLKKIIDLKLEVVYILNNDLIVTNDWDQNMSRVLRQDKVGLVGPLSNEYLWAKRMSAKVIFKYKADYNIFHLSLDRYAKRITQPYLGVSQLVIFLGFWCVGIKSEMIKKVGFLSEEYGLGIFDDMDYCFRVQAAGYQIHLVKSVYVHHFHHQTFIARELNYCQIKENNRHLFRNKYGIDPDKIKAPGLC